MLAMAEIMASIDVFGRWKFVNIPSVTRNL